MISRRNEPDLSQEPMSPLDGPPVDIPVDEPLPDATNPDGSMDVPIDEPQKPDQVAPAFGANLAEYMEESALMLLGGELKGMYDDDKLSRQDWEKTYKMGLEFLGMKFEDKTKPWPGACGVQHPVIAEAVVRFQSNAIMEIFPSDAGPVKSKIVGDITPDKEDQADRVTEHMNWTLTEQISGYRLETEKLLFGLGLAGCAVRKIYQDPVYGRPALQYIPAEDFIIPYGSSSLETAPRYAHYFKLAKNDLRRLQIPMDETQSAFYRDIDLGEPPMLSATSDLQDKKDKIAREVQMSVQSDFYEMIETHVDLVLDGDEDPNGIALPYVVTFEYHSSTIIGIRRNWLETDKRRLKVAHFAKYDFIPGIGAYGIGLTHLIGAIAKGSTALLQQLVDAGSLANLSGGFKTKEIRIKDTGPILPGEWRDAEGTMGELAKGFFVLPYKDPSSVLYELLKELVDLGRRMGSIADIDVGDMSSQAPVGTTLAIMERSLKIMSAVQARIHTSLHDEFKILKRVIQDNLPDEYPYDVHGASRTIKKTDYSGIDVVPVSNPNSATMAERVLQYQAATQLAAQFPQGYDMAELHREFLRILGIKNVDKILPQKDKVPLLDPVQENLNLSTGKPVKVFESQNHDAHIQTHMSYLKDPLVAQLMGQNPQAQAIMGAIQSHVTEHLAFKWRSDLEQQLGTPLPGIGMPLPPDMESSLSLAIAEAAQQVLQADQQKAQAQQAAQQAQDPILQIEKQKLIVEHEKVNQKRESDQMKVQADMEKSQAREQTERMRIAQQGQAANQSVQASAGKDAQNLQLELRRLTMEQEEGKARIAEILARIDQMQYEQEHPQVVNRPN